VAAVAVAVFSRLCGSTEEKKKEEAKEDVQSARTRQSRYNA
jgi:hypothetical protein